MNTMTDLVRRCMVDLVHRRQDVVSIAVRHRAKFEGWLKFELAAALASKQEVANITPELEYQDGSHCDLYLESGTKGYYVELKTCNTLRAKGVEPKNRPITMNVSGVIRDIGKLRKHCGNDHGIACFLFFPVPTAMWNAKPTGIDKHLERIESESSLPTGSLRKCAEFVVVTEDYGIAVFTVEAV